MKLQNYAIVFLLILLMVMIVWAQESGIENSVGVRLILVSAGSFTMGSNYDEKWHQADENPQQVTISKPFYMSVTEITQEQWQTIMGFNRSNNKGNNMPVEKISWKDAVTFCEKLSIKEGKTYRLPTESEWEYACKTANDKTLIDSNNLKSFAWYYYNSDDATHPVAQKQPNALGLYDMLGNVSEWCADIYRSDYSDSVETEKGAMRVIRGGAYDTFPPGLRCAARSSAPASYQYTQTGFRIVLEP